MDDLYSSTVSTTVTTRKKSVTSQKQKNAVRDLRERLQSLSDLLQGRPFDSPKSATFLQKKILSQLYEEMAKKCEGDLLRVNFSRVFSVLPQALRQLFVNSYQSLLWNEVALDRLKDNKHNTVLSSAEKGKKTKSKKVAVDQISVGASEASYLKSSVVELKAILKERGLKVSGKKEELVSRLTAHDIDNTSSNSGSSSSSSSSSRSTDGSAEEHSSPTGFLVSDTAVVGDIVLVDLAKRPLTAWHVAAQNISLNGNHILEWSEGVGTVQEPVPVAEVPVVINSNTPFNMNPNSPFYKGKGGAEQGDTRGDSRGGRSGSRGDRGRREEGEEGEAKEEVRELKACYHAVTRCLLSLLLVCCHTPPFVV
jgi:SAP domain/tRNA pseudouridine synthase D (TruD)